MTSCSAHLAVAIGGVGEGIGAWGAAVAFAYVLAEWMGAAVAKPCVSSNGRLDVGPNGCEAGAGYSLYLERPARVCATSYADLGRREPILMRHVAFLDPSGKHPLRPADGATWTANGTHAWRAPLPHNRSQAAQLALRLAAHNISLALLADEPHDARALRSAILHPGLGGGGTHGAARFFGADKHAETVWRGTGAPDGYRLPREAQHRRVAAPIRQAALNFTAGLGASYLLAHWRLELMQASDAKSCARSLHRNAQDAIHHQKLPPSTPLVLMSDAPHASLCRESGVGLKCKGWHGTEAYSAPEVRQALRWLQEQGWHKADEQWARIDMPLLRESNLARYLAEYTMALDASVFVYGSNRCTDGRQSAHAVEVARKGAHRPNWIWST